MKSFVKNVSFSANKNHQVSIFFHNCIDALTKYLQESFYPNQLRTNVFQLCQKRTKHPIEIMYKPFKIYETCGINYLITNKAKN